MSSKHNEEDAPIDPDLEYVRKRMLRLMIVSIGIMSIGLIAAVGAIIYRISNSDAEETTKAEAQSAQVVMAPSGEVKHINATSAFIEGVIDLPEGGRLISTEFSDNRILLTVKDAEDNLSLWIYDVAANRVFVKLKVK